LFLFILTAINFQFVEAELSLNFPQEVSLNTEFKVSLISQSTKLSDVKIFVHNSSDEKILRSEIISQILGTAWQDSWLYINSVFPSQKEFTLKIDSYANNAKICAQLRETNKTATYEKVCAQITIRKLDNSQPTEETTENSNLQETSEIIEKTSEVAVQKTNQETSTNQEKLKSQESQQSKNKITALNINSNANPAELSPSDNSPIKLSPSNKLIHTIYSKDYKVEKGIIYSAFIVLALVLFIIFVKR